MFAKRRPKPQDPDEEPLVPHGLIWQATDEPEKPKIVGSETTVDASALPNALKRDLPPVSPASSPENKKPVSSTPIAWPTAPAVQPIANNIGGDAPQRPRPVLIQPAGTAKNHEAQQPAKNGLAPVIT